MKNREWLITHTRISFLIGLIVCLLSLQFVFPPLIVLFLVIIPAVVALTFASAPGGASVAAIGFVSVVSFGLFGIINGIWMLVYAATGLVLGWADRVGLRQPFRSALMAFAFFFTLAASALAFAFLAGIGFQQAVQAVSTVPPIIQTLIIPVFLLSLFTWSMLNALSADSFFNRVSRQLSFIHR